MAMTFMLKQTFLAFDVIGNQNRSASQKTWNMIGQMLGCKRLLDGKRSRTGAFSIPEVLCRALNGWTAFAMAPSRAANCVASKCSA
jgi:hypothetical protein